MGTGSEASSRMEHITVSTFGMNQYGVNMPYLMGVDLHKTQFHVHVRTEKKIEALDEIKVYLTIET